MRKLISRWISLGLGTDQVSGRTFMAGFSPSNYNPAQTGSEGTDKVSAHLKGIDTKLGVLASVNYVDQLFTGNGSSSRVTLSQNLSVSTVLDVFANGVLLEEDVDFERDVDNDQIVWLDDAASESNIPNLTRLRVRLYSSAGAISDEFFSGGVSTLYLIQAIEEASRIDVYFNGVLMEEGVDWTRNTVNNTVSLVDNQTTSLTSIRVRVWN